jgi:hypothetical protein
MQEAEPPKQRGLKAATLDGGPAPQPLVTGANVTVVYSDIESVAHLSRDFVTGTPPPASASSGTSCLNQEYDPTALAHDNRSFARTPARTWARTGAKAPLSWVVLKNSRSASQSASKNTMARK